MTTFAMVGRENLQGLTRGWLGVTLFTAGLQAVLTGNVVGVAIGSVISLAIVYAIGRSLLNRSAFTRGAMLIIAGLSLAVGAYGFVRLFFFESWSLASLLAITSLALSSLMNVKSLKVLTAKSTNAYFGDTV